MGEQGEWARSSVGHCRGCGMGILVCRGEWPGKDYNSEWFTFRYGGFHTFGGVSSRGATGGFGKKPSTIGRPARLKSSGVQSGNRSSTIPRLEQRQTMVRRLWMWGVGRRVWGVGCGVHTYMSGVTV